MLAYCNQLQQYQTRPGNKTATPNTPRGERLILAAARVVSRNEGLTVATLASKLNISVHPLYAIIRAGVYFKYVSSETSIREVGGRQPKCVALTEAGVQLVNAAKNTKME